MDNDRVRTPYDSYSNEFLKQDTEYTSHKVRDFPLRCPDERKGNIFELKERTKANDAIPNA